jgi:hypothetical protein
LLNYVSNDIYIELRKWYLGVSCKPSDVLDQCVMTNSLDIQIVRVQAYLYR